jgi:hypothetical protein
MSLYTISPGTLPLASDVEQLVDVFNGKHDIGAITFAPVLAIPTLGAASASATAGAGLSVGVYKYVFTYKTGYKKTNGTMNYAGETTATSLLSATTTSANSQITLTSLPTAWPASAVGLAIYRTTVGGSTYKMVTVITTPATSYVDTLVDVSLGANVPTVNTTGTVIADLAAHKVDYTEHVPYGGVTTGTANTYVLAAPAISALSVGMAVSVKFNVDSTAASTLNWNGMGAKGIKKSNGTDVTNLKATGIYTLRYDGTNFILQGEGGSGNAIAAHLLAGETASTDAGDIVGSMVNRSGTTQVASGSSVAGTTLTLTNPTIGYQDTASKLSITDANFIAANILSGKNILGVTGSLVQGNAYASGSVTSSGTGLITVTGLSFTPKTIIIRGIYSGNSSAIEMVYDTNAVTPSGNQIPLQNSVITHSGSTVSGSALSTNWNITANGFSLNAGYVNTLFNYYVTA